MFANIIFYIDNCFHCDLIFVRCMSFSLKKVFVFVEFGQYLSRASNLYNILVRTHKKFQLYQKITIPQ